MTHTVEIPKRFFDDHRDRDLPTPAIVEELARHYRIDLLDPYRDELICDAEHYGFGGIDPRCGDGLFGLISSARATHRALVVARAVLETEINRKLDEAQPESCSAETRNALHACRSGHPLGNGRGRAECFEGAAWALTGCRSTHPATRDWLETMARLCREARARHGSR